MSASVEVLLEYGYLVLYGFVLAEEVGLPIPAFTRVTGSRRARRRRTNELSVCSCCRALRITCSRHGLVRARTAPRPVRSWPRCKPRCWRGCHIPGSVTPFLRTRRWRRDSVRCFRTCRLDPSNRPRRKAPSGDNRRPTTYAAADMRATRLSPLILGISQP
jgi:hypothetical protein